MVSLQTGHSSVSANKSGKATPALRFLPSEAMALKRLLYISETDNQYECHNYERYEKIAVF